MTRIELEPLAGRPGCHWQGGSLAAWPPRQSLRVRFCGGSLRVGLPSPPTVTVTVTVAGRSQVMVTAAAAAARGGRLSQSQSTVTSYARSDASTAGLWCRAGPRQPASRDRWYAMH